MSKIKLQPTEEMIKAGILELKELPEIRDAYYSGNLSNTNIEDLVVFIWQAMAGNYKD